MEPHSTQALLLKNPALRLARPPALDALARDARTVVYRGGAKVLTRGMPQDAVAFLAQGRMQLYAKNLTTGSQVLQAVISSPAIFGDAELYSGVGEWGVSAKAFGLLTVVWIPCGRYDSMLASEPQVAAALYRNACVRLMMAVKLNLFMSLAPTHQKILHLFRTAARDQEASTPVSLSIADIARAIGVDRKTVMRNMAALSKAGSLVRKGEGWVLTDPAAVGDLEALGNANSWRLPKGLTR